MFKSIKTGVLALILVATAVYAHAQKKISEGIVNYDIHYSLTEEQKPMEAMLPKNIKVKFNGNLSKVNLEQGPAQITVTKDGITNLGTMLIDVPVAQLQMAVKLTKADHDKMRESQPKFSDFKATGEKQTIAGYNTQKYTYKDDKGADYELWATTDIELPAGLAVEDFKDVKGALVKFTAFQNGIKSTSTLKNIEEVKVGALSLAVPSGYELKTMDEIMAMSKGGQ